MAYNMFTVLNATNLVQDIGLAVPEPAFIKYRANSALHARVMDELLTYVRNFMTEIGLPGTTSINDVEDYFRAMARNRAFGAPGTTPGNSTFLLFLLARELQPKVIVESGVWAGSSLFTFRHAVPEAKLFVPSISMIENDRWVEGDTVEWNWHGRRLRYVFRDEDTFGAKTVIKSLHRFPSLKRLTGMEDGYHYYVRLKD
jgi:hypothetical protein